MDVGLIRVGLMAVALTVSLAAYLRSSFVRLERSIAREGERRREDDSKLERAIVRLADQQREDFRTLSQQRREDHTKLEGAIVKLTEKLAETTERTARIEGILARGWMPQLEATAAQAVPNEPPDTR